MGKLKLPFFKRCFRMEPQPGAGRLTEPSHPRLVPVPLEEGEDQPQEQAVGNSSTQSATSQPTTWHDLPPDICVSIIHRLAGPEPMKTGNLRHMAVCKEWLSVTRSGVRSLCFQFEWERPNVTDLSRSQLSCFPNLQSLIIDPGDDDGSSCAIQLCSIASTCHNLEVLHCKKMGVTEASLRAVLQSCLKLRELNCGARDTMSFSLPQEIGNLTALTSLSLRNLIAEPLPDTMSKLICLQELTLHGYSDSLREINPACFFPASPLRSIKLRCNSLEALPDSFTMLQQLESLELDASNFTQHIDSSSLSYLTLFSSLTYLDLITSGGLDACRLFSDLPGLRVLKVISTESYRTIEIPAFGRYTCLEVLHLTGLYITTLPESLCHLSSLTELKLEECLCLSNLPESFSQLQSLQQLVLDDLLSLVALPEMVELPACLTSLTIGSLSTTLHLLPDSLWSCLSLQRLHIGNLTHVSLPEAMGQLTALTELHISSCDNLRSLPAALRQLSLLQSMEICNCHELTHEASAVGAHAAASTGGGERVDVEGVEDDNETEVEGRQTGEDGAQPATGACGGSLKSLCIERCSCLVQLPLSLGSLFSLTHLEIDDCELLSLPDSIGSLSSLSSLKLSGMGLVSLPESLSRLSSLCDLIIESCELLQQLPSTFGQLKQLTSLDVSDCPELRQLSPSFSQLASLQKLSLDKVERLTSLPESFTCLPALAYLSIKEAPHLTSLTGSGARHSWKGGSSSRDGDSKLQGACFPSLKYLTLESCERLRQLPKNMGQMRCLTHLTVYSCDKLYIPLLCDLSALVYLHLLLHVCSLPRAINRLTNLTSLTLMICNTRFTALPNSICQLSALKELYLAADIRVLPHSFGQLQNLTSLSLRGCPNLRRLPDSFTQLVGLHCLDLNECDSLVTVPLINGQLPGNCHLEVTDCPHLQLPTGIRNVVEL